MVNFKSKLKKFSKTVKTAKQRAATEGYGAELNDGVYKAKITSCELKESNAGEVHLVFNFEVVSGDDKGAKVSKWCKVETEDDQVWLERDLARFGIELPDDLSDLVDIAKAIDKAKPLVKIQLKSKDSGQFSYINRVLDEVDFGDAAEPTEEDEDDDYDEEEEEEDDDAEEDEDEEDDEDDEEEDGDEDEDEDEDEEEVEEDEDEEEEAEDDDDEEAEMEIDVGMEVSFEGKKGAIMTGKIVKLMEDEGKVKIKVGTKTYTVAADELMLPEEPVETEPEPAPKKAKAKAKDKKKKKAAPAAAKKGKGKTKPKSGKKKRK